MFQIWWSICGLSWVKSPIVLLGGPLPFWSAVTMSGCTWLSIVFGQVIRVKLNPHQCQDLSFFFFSRSTPHCNKTINVNQLACQWFLCSGWLGTCMHKESHTYASTHTYTHTHKHTHKGFADTWLLTNCLHTSLGANALSQIIWHFSHREHLHNSLPVGAALKVSFC